MVLVKLPGIDLTEEQEAILETCQPPLQHGKGQLVRVTAAAGTGKTTSLLSLALQAAELGHTKITYLTFTKAAALDGTRRLSAALGNAGLLGKVTIDARTLHSCAFNQLVKYQSTKDPDADITNKIWSEKKVKKWIAQTLNDEIEQFLGPCRTNIESWQNLRASQKASIFRRARDRVEFFIFKTLKQFCTRSISFQQFQDSNCFDRNYYPAKKFHSSSNKVAEKLGFDARLYANKTSWYADQACKLCRMIVKEDIRTFDFVMKRAQLLALEIPGTILLIDESQDMDGCQVNWVAETQVKFSKQVYVVGDAAQTIYGFRGAKSQYLMDLSIDKEQMLTESWRFGPGIARIANLVLFAKENSDQTEKQQSKKWKNWIPYRVKAGKEKAAHVTGACLMSSWQDYRAKSEQITLIARQNKTLFQATLMIFGFTPEGDGDSTAKKSNTKANKVSQVKREEQADDRSREEDDDYDYVDDCTGDAAALGHQSGHIKTTKDATFSPDSLPKIHINGYGETSGRKTWLSMFKLIGTVYELFELSQEGEDSSDGESTAAMRLPTAQFPEFAGREVSWLSFCEDVREGEMNKYTIPISVVNMYQNDTMAAVERFKQEVIDKNHSLEEADLILSTCHAAKGMEWDNVQVLDDFIDFANYECDHRSQHRGFQSALKKQKVSKPWKFGFAAWGDDLNLAYVACTRARYTLSVSPFLLKCIQDFDHIREWKAAGDTSAEIPFIQGLARRQSDMTPQALEDIHSSLVLKYREEVGVQDDGLLIDYLLRLYDEDSMNAEADSTPAEVTPEAAVSGQYSMCFGS